MYLFIDILSDTVVDHVTRSLLSMYCDVWGRLGDVVWTEPTYVHFLMDLHRLPTYCINTACTLELWKELQYYLQVWIT